MSIGEGRRRVLAFFSLAFRLGFGGAGAPCSFAAHSRACLSLFCHLLAACSGASALRVAQHNVGLVGRIVWCVHTKVPREGGGHEEARQRLHTMCTYGCSALDHDGLGKGMKAWFILPHGLCATGSSTLSVGIVCCTYSVKRISFVAFGSAVFTS